MITSLAFVPSPQILDALEKLQEYFLPRVGLRDIPDMTEDVSQEDSHDILQVLVYFEDIFIGRVGRSGIRRNVNSGPAEFCS